MSNIDKSSLAKTRELATLMVERISMNPVSCKLVNEAWKKEFPDEVAIADRMLALLDELESKYDQIANLTAERDALREGEMGDAKHSNTRAAADIYFQLVEECEVPAGGSLVEYVSELRERAAMLQGADRNHPDGWVACSERMPEREVDVQVYCADKKEQMVGYMERNERNGYFRFASLPNGGGVYCQPTHWMLLPTAPQQEAKNV